MVLARVWHYWIGVVLFLAVAAGHRGHRRPATSSRSSRPGTRSADGVHDRAPIDWAAGRAHRRPGRGPGAVRRVVPLRLARARLRRAHRRGRGAGRPRRPACARCAGPGPGPGHRPRRLGAGQRRVVPAPAAPAHRPARRASSGTSAVRRRWPGGRPAPRSARCSAGCPPGCSASTTCSSSRTRAPHDQDLVYYVGPNVLALEKRFAFPPREFRLWLALHEVTHRAQFTGVPWLRPHFLVARRPDARRRRPRPEAVPRRPAPGRSTACATGRNPLDDGGLVALLATPEQREVLQQVGGLMSLLEGHGDVTMDRAGADRIPTAERFSRVLRQRRQQRDPGRPAAPAADRARGQAQPVRAGRAVHRRGRGRRRAGAAQPGVRRARDPARRSPRSATPAAWIERVRCAARSRAGGRDAADRGHDPGRRRRAGPP